MNAWIVALQSRAKIARDKEVVAIIAQAKDAIAHHGLTAADLGLAAASHKPGKSSGKP